MTDPLLGLALRVAGRWLRVARAAAPLRAVTAARVARGVQAAAFVRPNHPHPAVDPLRGPTPQAGEGEKTRRDMAIFEKPRSSPRPLAREGGARRRVRGPAAPHAPRPLPADPPPRPMHARALRPLPTAPAARLLPQVAAVPRMMRPLSVASVPRVAPRPSVPLPPAAPGAPRALPQRPASGEARTPPPETAPPDALPPPDPPPLDEARLARWLSAHLTEIAWRPARGGTGFDPRLAPAWPGTLQGPWGWGG